MKQMLITPKHFLTLVFVYQARFHYVLDVCRVRHKSELVCPNYPPSVNNLDCIVASQHSEDSQ